MGQLGFTTYVTPALLPRPTLKERLNAMSGAEKTSILNGFADKVRPNQLKHDVTLPLDLIKEIYREIDAIEETARLIMREEVLITEGTYDPETGEEITPPVYNDAPTSIADLKTEVALSFTEVFSVAQVGAVIDKIIAYSEVDADGLPIGTAIVYSEEIVK